MSRDRDLTSDPSAEHLADPERAQAELDAADARSGGNPDHAPRSLHAASNRSTSARTVESKAAPSSRRGC